MVVAFLWNTDFFEWARMQPEHSIDTIITDPPYKSFNSAMGEDKIGDVTFNVADFCSSCIRLLKPSGIFISFCSMQLMKDYFVYFNGKLRFRCEQIWDKRPKRSWVHYSIPLHHVEYIVYFGEGSIDFRTGDVNKKYRRSTFGGSMRVTKKNENKYSQAQFQQLIELNVQRGNVTNKRWRKGTSFPTRIEPIPMGDELESRTEDHPTPKPMEFSPYFKQVVQEPGRVIDPCCGTGSLIWAFVDAIGIDIQKWDPVSKGLKKGGSKKLEDFVS